jgi:hypothetical protein
MKIKFACSKCGQGYLVDASNSGRQARCKGCGGVMTVPSVAQAVATSESRSESDTYELEDPPPAPPPVLSNAFVATPAKREERLPRPKRSKVEKNLRAASGEVRKFAQRNASVWPWLVGVPAALAVALGLVALMLPNGTMIAGICLAVLGIVLMLVGYGVGAYAAYREDLLYGFLYVVFPLYTGYYIVANWDEMWRWFAVTTLGAAVLTVAITIMGSGLEKVESSKKSHEQTRRITRAVTIARIPRPVAIIGA